MADTLDKIIKISVNDGELLNSITAYNSIIEENRKQQKALDEQRKSGAISNGEYARSITKLKQEEKLYKAELRGVEKELQSNIRANNEAVGSYNDLQNQLKRAQQAFKAMSEAERGSAKGQELQKKVSSLQTQLKELDAEMAVYNRNVGNYQDAFNSGKWDDFADKIKEISPEMGGLTDGLKNVGAQVKAVFSNIWIAVILAVAAALKKLVEQIKGGGSAIESLKPNLASLNLILEASIRVTDFLVGSLGMLIDKVNQLSIYLTSLPTKAFDAIFGTNSNAMFDKLSAWLLEANQLSAERVALNIEMRKVNEENAKREQQFAEAQYKALQRNVYTAKERLDFILEAGDLQRKIAEENERIAKEDLRIYEADLKNKYISLNNATTDELNTLSEKRIAVISAETELSNKLKELAEKEVSFRAEIAAEIKAIEDERAANAKEAAERQAELSAELQAIEDKVRRATIALETDKYKQLRLLAEQNFIERKRALDAEANLTLEQYNILLQEIQKERDEAIEKATTDSVKAQYDAELEMQAERNRQEILMAELQGKDVEQIKLEQLIRTREALAEVEEKWNEIGYNSELAYQNSLLEMDSEIAKQREAIRTSEEENERKLLEDRYRIANESFGAINSVIGGVMELVDAQGEQGERYANFSKALAVFQIGVNTAQGLAEAIKSGAGVPFPANLAAIATGVGVVLSGIGQATAILAQEAGTTPKYHTGGVVDGSGEVSATLLGGESVMTRQATADFGSLLSELNVASGGSAIKVDGTTDFGGSYLYGVFRRALAEMPAPVVSVVDINRGQQRVEVIQSRARRSRS